jgi:hypothetical protein
MPLIYFRKVVGGGLKIYQLIFLSKVFVLSKNYAWWNGEKHGWKFQIEERKRTAL